jgi:hypothetical protein
MATWIGQLETSDKILMDTQMNMHMYIWIPIYIYICICIDIDIDIDIDINIDIDIDILGYRWMTNIVGPSGIF